MSKDDTKTKEPSHEESVKAAVRDYLGDRSKLLAGQPVALAQEGGFDGLLQRACTAAAKRFPDDPGAARDAALMSVFNGCGQRADDAIAPRQTAGKEEKKKAKAG